MVQVSRLCRREPVSTWIIDDGIFFAAKFTRSAFSVSTLCPPARSSTVRRQCQPQRRYAKRARSGIDWRCTSLRRDLEGCRTSSGGAHPGFIGVHTARSRQIEPITYHRRRRQDSGGEVVLADCFYGVRQTFGMSSGRLSGFDFGVAVNVVTRVWLLDAIRRRRASPLRATTRS